MMALASHGVASVVSSKQTTEQVACRLVRRRRIAGQLMGAGDCFYI
jgi:hypothetical protein